MINELSMTRRARLVLSAALLTSSMACGANAPAPEEEHTELAMNDGRVTLTDAAMRAADVRTALVGDEAVASEGGLVAPGAVELDPRRVAVISSRVDGRLERLNAVAGDAVQAGDVVARVFSVAFLSAQEDLLLTERRVEQVAGTADSTGAARLARGAARRLSLMGFSETDLATLRTTQEPLDALPIRAPLTGTILESHAMTGAAVTVGAPIFTVADLTELDVVAEIPEASIPLVRIGQRASIEVAAYPGVRFSGSVERLHDVLNSETRTVRAVLHVANPRRTLRPGMYASVRLAVAGAASGPRAVIVPTSAIVTDGESRIVFVHIDSTTFERREVRVESLAPAGSMRPAGDQVRIAEGLAIGERIVVRGAFALKSELAKASLGDSH
jgi:RND family efflux transporter MFP subunit